jgi:hypothetical protein
MSTISELLAAKKTRIEARLALYVAAEEHILRGAQSYSIGNRTLTRGDLDDIAKWIAKLESDLIALTRGGSIQIQRAVPRDW